MRQPDPGKMKVCFLYFLLPVFFLILRFVISSKDFLSESPSQVGKATFNIYDLVPTYCLHLAVPPVQFRKLRKDKGGWAITKIFAILTMEGGGVSLKQAFKFYKGCVDEILRMCLRAISKNPDNVDGNVFGVFHHESLSKAVKHLCFMYFFVMMSRSFTDWFKELVVGTSVVTTTRPIE